MSAAGWPVLLGSAADPVCCTVGLLEIFTACLLYSREHLDDVCPRFHSAVLLRIGTANAVSKVA